MTQNTNDFSFLKPESIAVIGASNDPLKRGYQAMQRLKTDGFPEEKIYPINPKDSEVCGIRGYKSVMDVGKKIDLALVCTPAKTLPAIVEECGKAGVSCCIVIASGFSEEGDEGAEIERKMLEAAKKKNVRIMGPNTNGMFNMHQNVNLVGLPNVPKGQISIISQSGNILLSLVNEAVLNENMGFATFVGVGNQSDLGLSDYVAALSDDDDTACIFIYAEGFKDGHKFLDVARQAVLKKPIMLYKSGRTHLGQIAANSHTGALAANYQMSHDVLRQAGITVLDKTSNISCIAKALIECPKTNGNRVAVLTDGGGHGTIAIDTLIREDLEPATFSEYTIEKLKSILPPAANVMNPVDVAGQTDRDTALSAQCVDILLQDPNVDILMITGMWGGFYIRFSSDMLESEINAANAILEHTQKHKKPVLVQSLYAPEQAKPLAVLSDNGIPIYMHVETCVSAVKAVADYSADCDRLKERQNLLKDNVSVSAKEIINEAYTQKRSVLLEHEGRAFLRYYGVALKEEFLLGSEGCLDNLPASLTEQPVAMKIVSEDILHKSDAKGVMLNVNGVNDIRASQEEILKQVKKHKPNANIAGIMVTPMVPSGIEVILGAYRDDTFGPVLMFGLGGVFVEVFKDVSFRSVPLSKTDAKDMINSIHASILLRGIRNTDIMDENALVDLILLISKIMQAHPEIVEIDLNPIIVRPDGLDIADVCILLKDGNL